MTETKGSPREAGDAPVDIAEWKRLTPRQLVKRLSLGSWALIVTVVVSLSGAMFTLGQAFKAGILPFEPAIPIANEQTPRDGHDEFSELYSNIVEWKTLQTLARGIAERQPDGLDTLMDIAASLLSQVRSSGGTASFLYGEKELTMTATIAQDEISFEWNERPSPLPRIANDAGYQLNSEGLKEAHVNLNRNGFAYLDAGMEHAVIYRNADGTLGLVGGLQR